MPLLTKLLIFTMGHCLILRCMLKSPSIESLIPTKDIEEQKKQLKEIEQFKKEMVISFKEYKEKALFDYIVFFTNKVKISMTVSFLQMIIRFPSLLNIIPHISKGAIYLCIVNLILLVLSIINVLK